MNEFDPPSRHHILHERAFWNAHKSAMRLRTTHSLIPRIYRSTHDELHDNCPPVPILGTYALFRTAMAFEPVGETFQDIDLLCKAIDRGTKRSHPLERDVGGLAIESIRNQIPFIRDGLVL